MNENDIHQYLSRTPVFTDAVPADYRVERLGGLTNLVYAVHAEHGSYVLRIAGEGTEDYIDRTVEKHNARVAAAAGVSPEVLYFDATSGLMLTRYIQDSITMNPVLFKDPERVRRAATAMRRLHQYGEAFQTRFDLFEKMDEYLALLEKLDAPIPDGYAQVKREADAVRAALAAHPAALAPCHCDPLAENFIDTGQRMWVVDWEYSGMNDPMWDLGDVAVEAEFDEQQEAVFMQAYFAGEPPPAQLGRMVLYKAMCDLLWTLWGVIQHANDNPADDFWTYALNRFERCKKLMSDASFGRHLQAVKAG